MSQRMVLRASLTVLAASAVLALAHAVVAQPSRLGERFTFVAANTSEAGPTAAGRLEIVVNRWSTEPERDRLVSVLTESGPKKLIDALSGWSDAGYMNWPGTGQYILRYAHRMPRPDGGEDVVLATDRPIWLWWDSAQSARSIDNPFTVIQLRLNKNGTGEGKLSLSGKIGSNSNKEMKGIVLEDYANQPALLSDVRRESAL